MERIKFKLIALAFVFLLTVLLLDTGTALLFVKPQLVQSQATDNSVSVVIATPFPTEILSRFTVPSKLQIEKLGIDAVIKPLGLTAEGNLAVPDSMAEVGWYSAGTIPGEAGSAVLDGHLGIDEWGVFADLNKLEIGDSLRVIDAQGKVATFKVRDKQIYQRDLRLEDVFFNRQGDTIAHLNLITCSGAYNKNTGGTSSRLVVFTDLQEF